MTYLQSGLPVPVADALDAPFWEGLSAQELRLQRCLSCQKFQWGPEWVCHRCLEFDLGYEAVTPEGVIYSFERVWHPVHPALRDQGPYLIVLVSLPHADNVRLVGNLLGDPLQPVRIGARVHGVFEHHELAGATGGGEIPTTFTLLQWRLEMGS